MHPKYRPDIDGLRAVAVVSVVVFHAFPSIMPGGFVGVDVFFVISGFLISTIIFGGLLGGGFGFYKFYARRVKRIFPALICVLVACLLFGWLALLPGELKQLGKHVLGGAGFAANLVFWQEVRYFDRAADLKPLLHLWSLGIEEQFYLIWPVLLWLAVRLGVNLGLVCGIFGVSSFFVATQVVGVDPSAAYYGPFARFWELIAGASLAWVSTQGKDFRFAQSLRQTGPMVGNLAALAGAGLLAAGFLLINKDAAFPGYWALLPVLGAVLIIAAGPDAWLNRHVMSSKPFVWVGLISYPLYLWHWPILSFGRIIENDIPHRDFRILAILLSFALAWLTVKFIERPIRFEWQGDCRKLVALCVAMIGVALVGAWVMVADRVDSRKYEDIVLKRKSHEYVIGNSLDWYEGKDGWLFLGNSHDAGVAKLTGALQASPAQTRAIRDVFVDFVDVAAEHGVMVGLLVGSNKESVYPEYLPDVVRPSASRYIDAYLGDLSSVSGLIAHDPTADLLQAKREHGLLYWRTDTHWNSKGAYFAYVGMIKKLGFQPIHVDFEPAAPYVGDLVRIANLPSYPVRQGDNWNMIGTEKHRWREEASVGEKDDAFGAASVVTNDTPLENRAVWVVGDSFSHSLRPYFNATFREVRYVGHWSKKLGKLAEDLREAPVKPDAIIIVRVERSF